jgi:hypothetical protein
VGTATPPTPEPPQAAPAGNDTVLRQLRTGGTPTVSADGHDCELHRYHWPTPLYYELHHIVPRAWQNAWKPAGEHRVLWAPSTATLCRTAHGNVHVHIVELMWELRSDLDIRAAVAKIGHGRRHSGELELALQALTRFTEAGGDLGLLIGRNLWGGI